MHGYSNEEAHNVNKKHIIFQEVDKNKAKKEKKSGRSKSKEIKVDDDL